MFASQAALVISNARTYRDEQRARAYLETLVNTAPVGVLVFDADTRALTSANREAQRIARDLLLPGRVGAGTAGHRDLPKRRRPTNPQQGAPSGQGSHLKRDGTSRGDHH